MKKYYNNYKKINIKNNQDWFYVYELPENVYAIAEPKHFQEVNSYLIKGEGKDILLDTGMGICNIKKVVAELSSNNIIVVNSHFHFDHIGNNSKFNEIFAFKDKYVENIAQNGLKKEAIWDQLKEDSFEGGYPSKFKPENYFIEPYNAISLMEGDRFDLGNRVIEVIHTPGHSNDSIMLYDKDNNILFTGDTFYLGPLYAHFNCREFGVSNINDYYNSIKKIEENYSKTKALYCSHNKFIADFEEISKVKDALEEIITKRLDYKVLEENKHSYLEDQDKLLEYNFKNFSIITSK